MMPIATLDLDHCTLVLLSSDDDGFGFYVATPHDSVTWDDAGERCVIATPDGDDEITADELDDLRRGVAREFRRKGEDARVVRSTYRRGLWAECLHGDAPEPVKPAALTTTKDAA